MELRAARPGERDQVLDLLAGWYGDRSFFSRYNLNDPSFRDELCLVAEKSGRIVATVQIFDRTINLCGQPVSLGGIGSVFTEERCRGRGIGSALIERSVTTMRDEGFELSMLFAERKDFYARFGWRSASRIFSAIAGADAIGCLLDFEIASFDLSRDFAEVAEIHRAYSSACQFTVIRDNPHWRANLHFAGNPDEHFVVCRRAESIDAYARAIWFHGVPMVMEFGYDRGEAAIGAILALFRHLGEAAAGKPSSFRRDLTDGRGALLRRGATPTSLLVAHTAHDPILESRLAAAGAAVFHHADDLFMWQVIAPERIAERLGVPEESAVECLFEKLAQPAALYWTADRF
jgi:predicted N-acetyltransferase YhbS